MSLFDTKFENDVISQTKLKAMIHQLKKDYEDTHANDSTLFQYLDVIAKRPGLCVIQPLELFVEVFSTMIQNTHDFSIYSYYDTLQKAEAIYHKMFPYGVNTDDFAHLAYTFVNFFKPNGLTATELFDMTLMSTFNNKQNYVEYMNTITDTKAFTECLNHITQYALTVRQYFVDDATYTANMKQITQKLLLSGNKKSIIDENIQKVEHMAGIYNIDEMDVAKTEAQLVQANALLTHALDILTQADKKSEQLNRIMKDTSETIQAISKRETDLLTSKALSAKADITAAYNSFLETQRQEILIQKDVLLGQLFQEAEDKLNELRTMSRAITATANSELIRINTETTTAMDKLSQYISKEEHLSEVLAKAAENNELYDKIAKLELLNNQTIEALTKNLESQNNAVASEPNATKSVSSTALPTSTQVIVTSESTPKEEAPAVIPTVNPLLDPSIPFMKRFEMVKAEKARRMKLGEHFHEMFDDVITVLMENANPYLIGPSGCGKTFMINQIASILNLDFIDIGYINEEYDILGFQTANGGYSTPNFYRCYKYGKIAFCDELDNGNSRATVKLNSFLSSGTNACYSFPNGENVKRHANFRIIAAGNTSGNGADANYNTREKIEESVQQRFTPIYVGYDNAVEEKILGSYTAWYQFVVLFRQATDAWGNQNDCAASGIITTRDTARIKQYLDNGSLDMARILNYEFIQTKDLEYLAFLSKFMGERIDSYGESRDIYTMFDAMITSLRKKGGIR